MLEKTQASTGHDTIGMELPSRRMGAPKREAIALVVHHGLHLTAATAGRKSYEDYEVLYRIGIVVCNIYIYTINIYIYSFWSSRHGQG